MKTETEPVNENRIAQAPASQENLVAFKSPPSPAWIELLEDALTRAKTGEVTGGALIESRKDTIRTVHVNLKNKFEFAGLLQNVIRNLLE